MAEINPLVAAHAGNASAGVQFSLSVTPQNSSLPEQTEVSINIFLQWFIDRFFSS